MGNAQSSSSPGGNSVALGLGIGLASAVAVGATVAAWKLGQNYPSSSDSSPKKQLQTKQVASPAQQAQQPVRKGLPRQVCDGDSCRLVWDPEPEQVPVVQEEKMGCCPIDSHPDSGTTERRYAGEKVKIDIPVAAGLEPESFNAYMVGQPVDGRCVIVVHDIYGFMAGRTTEFCDDLASAGYLVIMPNFYGDKVWDKRPETLPDFASQFRWHENVEAKVAATMDFAEKKGAEAPHFGMVGFCWGSYVVWHASATFRLAAGASFHPSHTRFMEMLDEDPHELAFRLQCPQLMYTSAGDSELDKPGGAHAKAIEHTFPNENDIVEFHDMKHGWVSRGDAACIPRIKEAQDGVKKFFHRLL